MATKKVAVGIDLGGTNTVFGLLTGREYSRRGAVKNHTV